MNLCDKYYDYIFFNLRNKLNIPLVKNYRDREDSCGLFMSLPCIFGTIYYLHCCFTGKVN